MVRRREEIQGGKPSRESISKYYPMARALSPFIPSAFEVGAIAVSR